MISDAAVSVLTVVVLAMIVWCVILGGCGWILEAAGWAAIVAGGWWLFTE